MKENVVFYKCEICENVIGLITGNPESIKCCEKQMKPLIANNVELTNGKHIPSYKKIGNEIVIKVGEESHLMDEGHYIMWIAQVTGDRTTRVKLTKGKINEIRFPYIEGSSLYAYCNKHGLWKCEVK